MIIATVALAVASVLAFGMYHKFLQAARITDPTRHHCCSWALAIRQMLITENKRLDREERQMTEAKRQRIEEAARLEGLTLEEALERNKGFRYLY